MAADRLPNEIKLKIVETLGVDDDKLFLLRSLPRNNSYISQLLQSQAIGDHLLNRYETHEASDSVRPLLSQFDYSQAAIRDRREKETVRMQHMLGRPCQQICNKPLDISITTTVASIHPILKGGYFAFAAWHAKRSHTCVILYDIVNTTFFQFVAGSVRKPADITGLALTDRLLALATTKNIVVYRLNEIGSKIEPHCKSTSHESLHVVLPQSLGSSTHNLEFEQPATLAGCDEYIAVLSKHDPPTVDVYVNAKQSSCSYGRLQISSLGSCDERVVGLLLEKQKRKDDGNDLLIWVFVANAIPKAATAESSSYDYIVRGAAHAVGRGRLWSMSLSYKSELCKESNTSRKAGFEFLPTGQENTWQVNISRGQTGHALETHTLMLCTSEQPKIYHEPGIRQSRRLWKTMRYSALSPDNKIEVASRRSVKPASALGAGTIEREETKQQQQVYVNDSFLVHFAYDTGKAVHANAFSFDPFLRPPNSRVLKRWRPAGGYSWRVSEDRWRARPSVEAHTQRSEWRPYTPRDWW